VEKYWRFAHTSQMNVFGLKANQGKLIFMPCQENIFDKTECDMCSSLDLQGFRRTKKPVPGTCKIFELSAKIAL
jgi:hypothetical protein